MSFPTRRAVPAVVAACVAGCMALVGCTSEAAGRNASELATAEEKALGHVHGLGVDPADDALYVASHFGVFKVEDGDRERVADRWQDTMGFEVIGPGHFLASGHPDPREKLPPSLGLIESTDAGRTWEPVSLLGEADLHAIELVGGKVYAYDAASEALIVSEDRQRWDLVAQLLPLSDIAVDPADAGAVHATTRDGELLLLVGGVEPRPVNGAPRLTAIDWVPGGPLVGVAPDGAVLVSENGRTGWVRAGTLDGAAEALDVIPGRWHAATQSGVYESTDDGAVWELVLARSVRADEED